MQTRDMQTIELLQHLIRNACVNDGSAESGQEHRNATLLADYLHGTGVDVERYEPTPGRVSLVARLAGSDPGAPSLCLMGHTDVVPVNRDGWTRDPFAGELINGEVWGRGAVDMLNLTASMAVVFRDIAARGIRPRGDLVFFAVADEESGSAHGARWMADHQRDAMYADYVLTENGGTHAGTAERPIVSMIAGEKGVAWRRLRVRGVPGHGSTPFRKDNALVTAAAVVGRLAQYRPPARFHELWRERVDTLDVSPETRAAMLDERALERLLDEMPDVNTAAYLHACSHTTFSCNVVHAGHDMKTNIIPDDVTLEIDIRTLPGEGADEVQAHLHAALGDLASRVEVSPIMNDPASISRVDTPLWDAMQRAVARPFPSARLSPGLSVGFTDSRIYRELGAVAYGAGLLSPSLPSGEFSRRFHGNDERIDVESLRLTTEFYRDVVTDFLL
jgi:acetylornithine deacetylase/succinyl-diaminopimelate desuccinylase-like protein